jgi:hypothetical protein
MTTRLPTWTTRPAILDAVDAPKPWGWELWLNSTRPEAPARLAGDPAPLNERLASHPEALGEWSRRLFGDVLPVFTKFIHTSFPSRVHLGFRRPVERGQFLAWLEHEQALLRRLFAALRLPDAGAFAEYDARYSAWASRQALGGWRQDDDGVAASALAAFVDPTFALREWLRAVRDNRAVIVDALNEIDLTQARGQLFLSSAGVIHAIFGLSHQTHPRDPARSALEALFAALAERAASGATDVDLARTIEDANLSALREGASAPAKNEAWLPAIVDGAEVLVEPQQTSDTTYSLADFYTPLVWGDDRVRFRKGEPSTGLSRDQLAAYLAGVDFSATPVDSIRRAPKVVPGASSEGAVLSCLVDEPSAWPFFTAYQLELTGRFTGGPPPGVFQQLVVTRGRAELLDDSGTLGELSPRSPAFIPATLSGRYTLVAREATTVLLFAVPGARGGAPRL